jgi:hypothetical protein
LNASRFCRGCLDEIEADALSLRADGGALVVFDEVPVEVLRCRGGSAECPGC